MKGLLLENVAVRPGGQVCQDKKCKPMFVYINPCLYTFPFKKVQKAIQLLKEM